MDDFLYGRPALGCTRARHKFRLVHDCQSRTKLPTIWKHGCRELQEKKDERSHDDGFKEKQDEFNIFECRQREIDQLDCGNTAEQLNSRMCAPTKKRSCSHEPG